MVNKLSIRCHKIPSKFRYDNFINWYYKLIKKYNNLAEQFKHILLYSYGTLFHEKFNIPKSLSIEKPNSGYL